MNQINRQIIHRITGAETRDLRSDEVRLMHVRRELEYINGAYNVRYKC